MPELPEVETVVRTLRPYILGRRLLSLRLLGASSCLTEGSLPLEEADGCSVAAVARRGKFVVLRLEKGRDRNCPELVLTVHLRMTGRLTACERPAEAAPDWFRETGGKYARALGLFSSPESAEADCVLIFSDPRKFGRLYLGTEDMLAQWPSWAKLGPEPLEMSTDDFVSAIRGRRAVKAVLLDQTVLAGVGNIYADESLYAARIRPDALACDLSPARLRRLHAELVRVLRLSIEECGSSIRDYQDADGNVGAFQNHFSVYGRGGEPCRHCGGTLRRVVLGGRGTVYCPRCQKK